MRHPSVSRPIIRYKGAALDADVRLFSNLWPLSSPLLFRGIVFHSSEHLYKWIKSKFFGDEDVAGKVLATARPRDLLSLARQKSAKWTAIQGRVMTSILIMKFGSCPVLQTRLLGTGNAHLVEDTVDPLWGCGRDGRGKNLHGRCLIDARAALRSGYSRPATVILGDSLLAGISVAGAEIVCIRGACAPESCLLAELFAQDRGVLDVILHIGTNDLFPRHPANMTVERARHFQYRLVQRLDGMSRRNLHINISISLILPRWCDQGVPTHLQRRASFNSTLGPRLEKLRAKRANVAVIDH